MPSGRLWIGPSGVGGSSAVDRARSLVLAFFPTCKAAEDGSSEEARPASRLAGFSGEHAPAKTPSGVPRVAAFGDPEPVDIASSRQSFPNYFCEKASTWGELDNVKAGRVSEATQSGLEEGSPIGGFRRPSAVTPSSFPLCDAPVTNSPREGNVTAGFSPLHPAPLKEP